MTITKQTLDPVAKDRFEIKMSQATGQAKKDLEKKIAEAINEVIAGDPTLKDQLATKIKLKLNL